MSYPIMDFQLTATNYSVVKTPVSPQCHINPTHLCWNQMACAECKWGITGAN